MSPPDDSVPEAIPDRPVEQTGEVSLLPKERAARVTQEIRGIAELRGIDSEIIELVLPPSGPVALPSATPSADDNEELSADELRDAWPLLDLEERGDGLRVLPREDAEDFFVALSAADQAALLLYFRPGQRRQWMRMLEPDDVADVIQHTGEQHKATLLGLLDVPTRKEVTVLLAYAEDEAGGLMSTRYARLRPQMTADEAVSFLRRQAQANIETIYVAYVLDPEQHLLGVVSFRELFAADPKKVVAEIMETDVIRVTDETDQETVSRLFAEHDLSAIPVVDAEGKMKGIRGRPEVRRHGGPRVAVPPVAPARDDPQARPVARAAAPRLDADHHRDGVVPGSDRSRAGARGVHRDDRVDRRQLGLAGVDTRDPRDGARRGPRRRLVADHAARAVHRVLPRPGAVRGLDGARDAVGLVRPVRGALRAGRARGQRQRDRLYDVRHARRRDAAVRAAPVRRGSRERLGAVRRDARRRQRHPDLFYDREPDPIGSLASIVVGCSPPASTTTAIPRRSFSG
jgi:CBS domain-containing protein